MTRHLDFDGIENFRDFGGYATACGRGVARGRLYRSANHHRASDADLARLRALGVGAIVDLRQPQEREREPSRRWDGFDAMVVENDTVADHPDWVGQMQGETALTADWFFQDGLGYYRRAPHEPRHVDLFARYFQALAEGEGAILVHCAAGKDRTGLICALTHHIAGVHPDDAMADYLLTNDPERLPRKVEALRAWLAGQLDRHPADEALAVAVSVHPQYLERAFGVIREAHGSVDNYLGEVLGVDQALRERIRSRVLA